MALNVQMHMRLICSVASQTELGDLAKYDGPQHKAHSQLQEPANYQGIESGLTFLGLCGLMDPPRPEVIAGITYLQCTDCPFLSCRACISDAEVHMRSAGLPCPCLAYILTHAKGYC